MSRDERDQVVVLASSNAGKIREIEALLAGTGLTVRSQRDFAVPDAEETGLTFVENALLKARQAARLSGRPAIADDSGLEVDALDRRPGVHSKRYGRDNATRIARLLDELDGVEEARRAARFICAMALAWPNGRLEIRRGVCEGRIAFAPAGRGGFGYDPVFFLPERGVTMAEIPAEEKNQISHRARAARAISLLIRSLDGKETT